MPVGIRHARDVPRNVFTWDAAIGFADTPLFFARLCLPAYGTPETFHGTSLLLGRSHYAIGLL